MVNIQGTSAAGEAVAGTTANAGTNAPRGVDYGALAGKLGVEALVLNPSFRAMTHINMYSAHRTPSLVSPNAFHC